MTLFHDWTTEKTSLPILFRRIEDRKRRQRKKNPLFAILCRWWAVLKKGWMGVY